MLIVNPRKRVPTLCRQTPGSCDHDVVMKAVVVFDTRYGNTEKVARALDAGLSEAGLETLCLNARDVAIDSLKQFDLICVGAPTEAFSAYKPMKEFLARLSGIDLTGRHGFAFDTKLDSRLSGSAARYIEKELISLGLQVVAPRESAIVFTVKKTGAITGARLKEGEEERFEEIGMQVGTSFAARSRVVVA